MNQPSFKLWHHCHLAADAHPDEVILDAAIVANSAGEVVWFGVEKLLPKEYTNAQRIDLKGAWVTPSLIDCHTHLIYGSNRADEFALRLSGASYEEIAQRGGGIVSTVRETRFATEEALFKSAAQRLELLMQEGVAVIEIKSGYGLDLATERKMLRVARRLQAHYPIKIMNTFLGAHTVPQEYQGRAQDYIDLVCNEMLPSLYEENLIDMVDVFCENIGFSLVHSQQVFEAAKQLGLPVKMHAEQLSDLGGSILASAYHALSTDHLEYLSEEGILAMKQSGTVAVLLPGAYYFIRETHLPPLALLRKHQIPIALATDHNPGTSPLLSMQLTMNLACTLFKMTICEVLQGVTVNAAKALGLQEHDGQIKVGRAANFAVWSVSSLSELAYWIGRPLCSQLIVKGQSVFEAQKPFINQLKRGQMDDVFCG